MGELGVAQQRLGGDAADVEADAAPVLLLDDRGRQAELGRADGGDVPARAGAQHDDIEVRAHGRQTMGTPSLAPGALVSRPIDDGGVPLAAPAAPRGPTA